ncbi:MAG: CoA transferase, partial [Chloroflexi bacterium]|nr:CoA transferase [Chloroflexota bacterium]
TVIEYAESPAVSFATRLLADLGADVLKVEPPGGDPTRLEGFVSEGADASALFAYVNAGKRSVVVDTSTGGGAAELRRQLRNLIRQ